MLDAKLLKPQSILHIDQNSLTDPLIIGTFEKRTPGLDNVKQGNNKI